MPVQKGRLKPEDYEKIQKNFTYICEEVDAKYIVDGLFEENVFTVDDVQEVNAHPSQGSRTKEMLYKMLQAGKGDAFSKFVKVMKEQYPDVVEVLEGSSPMPSAEPVSSPWSWFDELSDEAKSQKPKDGDLSRIASCFGDGWESVVLQLGMKQISISQEQGKHPNNKIMVLMNLLIRWRQSKGRAATLQCLVDVLRGVRDGVCELDMDGLQEAIVNMATSMAAPEQGATNSSSTAPRGAESAMTPTAPMSTDSAHTIPGSPETAPTRGLVTEV